MPPKYVLPVSLSFYEHQADIRLVSQQYLWWTRVCRHVNTLDLVFFVQHLLLYRASSVDDTFICAPLRCRICYTSYLLLHTLHATTFLYLLFMFRDGFLLTKLFHE